MHTVTLTKKEDERARRLHAESLVIDAMVDMVDEESFDKLTEVNKMIETGIDCCTIALFAGWDTPLQAIKKITGWLDFIDQHGDKALLVTKTADILRAKKEGKFGIILGTEMPDAMGNDLSLWPICHRLGMGHLQLAYYEQNLIGEGVGSRTDSGLTTFGLQVVKEMNKLGMIIDMAHCKDKSTMEAITFSQKPVIASHSNARGLVNHIRNKTDEQIKALAERGGVIALSAWSPFNQVRPKVRPTFDDYICHVDYIVKLVGVDYVGIGPDLTYLTPERYKLWESLNPNLKPTGGYLGRSLFTTESGYEDRALWIEITRGLVAHGYSDTDIQKIIGLNLLRVYKEIMG